MRWPKVSYYICNMGTVWCLLVFEAVFSASMMVVYMESQLKSGVSIPGLESCRGHSSVMAEILWNHQNISKEVHVHPHVTTKIICNKYFSGCRAESEKAEINSDNAHWNDDNRVYALRLSVRPLGRS